MVGVGEMVGSGVRVTVAAGFGVVVGLIGCEGVNMTGVKVEIEDFMPEHADNKMSIAARNIP